MLSDLKFALRQLGKSPGFTLVTLLTLALCIGANSAIFSVLHAVLLKPYPWPDSQNLVYIYNTYPKSGVPFSNISIPGYLDQRDSVPSFAESALIAGYGVNFSASDGQPERIYGLSVTPSLFSLLQTPPAFGRTFTDAEAQPGAAKTVVLNHAFWQSRFGGDRAVIGRDIRLDGETYTVIGVMPEGFYFPSLRVQFWVPFVFTPEQKTDAERGREFSTMIARLKPGATIAQAQREVEAVHRALRARLPDLREDYERNGFDGLVVGFLEHNVKDVRAMLWLLQAGVAAALLIGCANVANLLLTRATARTREFAIRAALGAGRGRLVRQLLAESLVLFLLGGALGLLVALWSLSAVNTLGVGNLPRGFGVALDEWVFAFTLFSTLLAGLVFGSLPAWSATRGGAAEALKAAGVRATADRHHLRLRGALAVAQIALSLMLLATAGLFAKSFARVQEQSPGFASSRVLTGALWLPAAKYATPEKHATFIDRLTAQLESLPGVSAVGFTSSLPFSGGNPQGGYSIDDFTAAPGQPSPHGMIRQVSPGYFKAMGITLVRGRFIEPGDTPGRENVVVIDRILADRYWPGGDPIGRRITRGGSSTQARGTWTIVGVVAPVKSTSLEQPLNTETLYFPLAQTPNTHLAFVVKTAALARVEPLAAIIRQAVLAIDPEQPVFDLKTMDARLDESLQLRRTPMLLLSLFAAVALFLAALGIYGVLAFSVGQRTQEIGVRMALGATRRNILGLILCEGSWLVLLGIGLGLGGYLALSRLIGQLLFAVSATDVATLLLAPLILAAVALLACWLPARRATKVDPAVALRAE